MNNELISRPTRLGFRPLALTAVPETGGTTRWRGALAGRSNHLPVRVSAPVAYPHPLCATGLNVRADVKPQNVHVGAGLTVALPAAPRQGGTRTTAATGDPDTPVAAVHHLVAAP